MVLIYLGVFALLLLIIVNLAPFGYEDKNGFHYLDEN